MTSPQIALAVVTYNSGTLVSDLLESLQHGLGELTWQLVVADNASTDGTAELVRRLAPAATVIEMGRNAGYAAGINAAAEAAGSFEAILVLNPDVRLDPNCVPQLRAALDVPGVGIAVPKLRDAEGRLIPSMRREPTVVRTLADAILGAERSGRIARLGEIVTDPARYDQASDTDWAEGSTQLISNTCWRRCGGWDESYFMYSEETEFNLRARDAGFTTRYVPDATATHLEGDSASSARLWPLLVVNRVQLFSRRHGRVRTALFWAATTLRELSRAAMGKSTSRASLRALTSIRRLRQPRGPEWLRL